MWRWGGYSSTPLRHQGLQHRADREIVIAETFSCCYDADGKHILQPKRRHHFSGRPMQAFLSQPLKIICRDMNEIQAFLRTCRYVSDREQFGVPDHWAPPEKFERTRQGDCDDFALWTWRQLLDLGYSARFVVGSAGRYGYGHAWVTLRAGERTFIVEATAARSGRTFPRLNTLRYRPRISVGVDNSRVQFFEHSVCTTEPPIRVVLPLIPEWAWFWIRWAGCWLRWPFLWPFWRVRRSYLKSGSARDV